MGGGGREGGIRVLETQNFNSSLRTLCQTLLIEKLLVSVHSATSDTL